MKFNQIILLITLLTFIISCKEKHVNKKGKSVISKGINLQKTPNLKEQNELIKNTFDKIRRISHSKNMGDIYVEYKKKDTIYWIEGAEDLKTKEKIIYYGESYFDKNNERNNYFLSLFLSNKNKLSLVSLHEYRYSNRKHEDEIKDTFFFKNNKIYFWKNKQATKEELLKKEKEILAIKREIDSVMEW